jgi:hypothetical protein
MEMRIFSQVTFVSVLGFRRHGGSSSLTCTHAIPSWAGYPTQARRQQHQVGYRTCQYSPFGVESTTPYKTTGVLAPKPCRLSPHTNSNQSAQHSATQQLVLSLFPKLPITQSHPLFTRLASIRVCCAANAA